jgi:hypothetical protein
MFSFVWTSRYSTQLIIYFTSFLVYKHCHHVAFSLLYSRIEESPIVLIWFVEVDGGKT